MMNIANSSKTVTTAGTRVQFTTGSDLVTSVYVEALGSNTGYIYVGLSTVSSTVYISRLAAGEGVTIAVDSVSKHTAGSMFSLSSIWLDSSVNGEKALVSYLTNV